MTPVDLRDKSIDLKAGQAIEKEIQKLVDETPRKGSSQGSGAEPVMKACVAAADFVKEVHVKHAEEGEELAKHLEKVGADFFDLCKEAAAKVRELRIVPREMAEKIASDLMHIGSTEAERHRVVQSGLLGARDSLATINSGRAGE